jgi:hypothetical protein
LLRLRVNLDGLHAFLKERDPSKLEQLTVTKNLGVSEICLAILLDNTRIVVPVVALGGDTVAIRDMLHAKEGILKDVVVPVGDDKFRLSYGSSGQTNHLDLTLTERGEFLILSVAEIDEATRASATARTQVLSPNQDRFFEFEFDVPEQLGTEGLQSASKQYGLSKNRMSGMVLFSVSMVLQAMLEPLAHIDQLAGGIFAHADKLTVLDAGIVYRDAEIAAAACAMLEGKQSPHLRFHRLVQLSDDPRIHAKRSLTGKKLAVRYAWKTSDETDVMPLIKRAYTPLVMRPLIPAEDEVTSTYHEDRPIKLPFDSAAWEVVLRKAFATTHARISGSHGSGADKRVNVQLDPPLSDNLLLVRGSVLVTGMLTKDGVDVKGDGDGFLLSDASGVRLMLPIKDGEDYGKIVRLTATLELDVPEQVEFCEFLPGDPMDTVKKAGSIPVTLGILSNNIAEVYTAEDVWLLLETYDKSGNRLVEDDGHWSRQEVSRSFHGTIARALAIAIGPTRKVSIDLDLDFAKTRLTRLPDEPTDPPFTRYIRKAYNPYPTIKQSALDDLKVIERAFLGERNLAILLPCPSRAAGWEVHAFGYDKPPVHRSGAWTHKPGCMSRYRLDPRSKPEIRAVFGRASVEIPVDSEVVTLAKAVDGEPVTAKLEGGGEIQPVFTRNVVEVTRFPSVNALSFALFDSAGRRLAVSGGGIGARQKVVAWGIPTRVKVELSPGTVTRVVEFDKSFGEVDTAAYEDLKQAVKGQREVARMVLAIRDAQNRSNLKYADNLAALHYLHGREGKPLHAIPAEVAHADAAGAAVFGYEHKPWKGYRFILPKGDTRNGEKNDIKRRDKPETFKWDGGELESFPGKFGMGSQVIAIPIDPEKPSFVARYGDLYHKTVGNDLFYYLPGDVYQWQKFSMIEPASADK